MARARKKKKSFSTQASLTKKSSPKSKGRNRYAWVIWAVFVGAVLLAEAASLLKNTLSNSKIFPVQIVKTFSGETQTCGAFGAWDVTVARNWIGLSDQGNKRLLIFDRSGNFKRQILEKQADPPGFNEISGVTHDESNHLYAMDTWNGFIRGFDMEGHPGLRVNLNDKGFFGPRGVLWNDGYFIVADTGSHRIVKVSSAGEIVAIWGSKGSKNGQFENPVSVVKDDKGKFYVVDADNHRVQRLDASGNYEQKFEAGSTPSGVAVDPKGVVYISSLEGNFVKSFNLNGKLLGTLTDADSKDRPIDGVKAMTVLENGDLLVDRQSDIAILRAVPPVAGK